MSGFTNGVQDAKHYLNAIDQQTIDVPTNITVDDQGTVTSTTTSFSLKELICSLLAGNGVKLPNLQICLKINIGRLLNTPGIPSDLYNALNEIDKAMDDFIAHTNIDNVLARLNAAIAEIAAIANMINFCGTPIVPKPIPNFLKEITGSFTGAGKELLDKLGTMLDSDIGGCIGGDGGFNAGIFQGGVLKDIGDLITEFGSIANIPANRLNALITELNSIGNDLQNLMKLENNFKGSESSGGSTFNDPSTSVNAGIGMALPSGMTEAQAQQYASALMQLHNDLAKYPVDDQGNNILYYLLDPELIAKLNNGDPVFPLEAREPVYDYCGRVIGFTNSTIQQVEQRSQGSPVQINTQPAVDGLAESGAIITSPPSTTTNLSNTNPLMKTNAPSSPIGKEGDKKGDYFTDGNYIYVASADYDGNTNIWVRASASNNW